MKLVLVGADFEENLGAREGQELGGPVLELDRQAHDVGPLRGDAARDRARRLGLVERHDHDRVARLLGRGRDHPDTSSGARGSRGTSRAADSRRPSPGATSSSAAMLSTPSSCTTADDNLLAPRPAATRTRLGAIRDALARRGDFDVALIGKARPDCLDADLARDLAALGVIRLYVGVENVSAGGARHLGRARQAPHVGAALDACRDAGIFVCYNLLLFEPDATLADLRDNVAFLRAHAAHPVNFCRAEPYSGTPLERGLRAQHNLDGSVLGFGYRIADDPTELAFRICSTAFSIRPHRTPGRTRRSPTRCPPTRASTRPYRTPRPRTRSLMAACPTRASCSPRPRSIAGARRAPRRRCARPILPMHRPPVVALEATREADALRVTLRGASEAMTIRWEGEGTIEGDGREVRWTPAEGTTGRLRVAVRTKGGIAVVSLAAKDAS